MFSVRGDKERILIVDDENDSRRIAAVALEFEGYEVKVAESGEQALSLLRAWRPHLVLLDMNMPGLDGMSTLTRLRSQESYVSVIFVSGQSNTEDVVNGLEAGADDYICKPYDPRELLARVKAQLRTKYLYDELRAANEQLTELIDIDDLTGLYNMRSLYERLGHEISRGIRHSRSVAVVMMDMDNFKGVNDGHDHLFGSFVLSEVGGIVKENIRSCDLAARYGGDEFLIVLTELNKQGAESFCERLRAAIEKYHFENDLDSKYLTASIGFAITDPKGESIDARSLVRLADSALYQAKSDGRNCVRSIDLADEEAKQMYVQASRLKKAQ